MSRVCAYPFLHDVLFFLLFAQRENGLAIPPLTSVKLSRDQPSLDKGQVLGGWPGSLLSGGSSWARGAQNKPCPLTKPKL